MTQEQAVTTVETHSTRIQRIMKNDSNWRAECVVGLMSRWITLHKSSEVALLKAAGVSEEIFEKDEHVFKSENQPLIQVKEWQNTFSFLKAWMPDRNDYISYVEWKSPVNAITPATPKPVAPKEMTFAMLNEQVDRLRQTRREQRAAQRDSQNVIVTPEDLAIEEAEIFREVAVHVDGLMDNYGKLQLANLWAYRQSGSYRKLPESPESIAATLLSSVLENRDYTVSLAHVVDKIFPEVEALSHTAAPFLNPLTSEIITVDTLIISKGLILKLTKSADLWSRLLDLDDKRKLLSAIVTETATQVAALREELGKITGGGGEGGDTIRISAKLEVIPGDKKHKRLVLIVDDTQQKVALRLLKAVIEDVQQ